MGKGIILSEKHGVNPSILKYRCPVCGKDFDGGIALFGRMKNDEEAPRSTQAGMEICSECKEQIGKGFICLVGIDPDKSKTEPDGYIKNENAHRTGKTIWIRKDVWSNMINKNVDKWEMMFVDPAIVDKLEVMAKELEDKKEPAKDPDPAEG